MDNVKNPVFSLNVLGAMGDDTQEFQIGASSEDTVSVQIGTVVLKDNGNGGVSIGGDIVASKIAFGDATITLTMDSSTEEPVITINGGKINLVGDIYISGNIIQNSENN